MNAISHVWVAVVATEENGFLALRAPLRVRVAGDLCVLLEKQQRTPIGNSERWVAFDFGRSAYTITSLIGYPGSTLWESSAETAGPRCSPLLEGYCDVIARLVFVADSLEGFDHG